MIVVGPETLYEVFAVDVRLPFEKLMAIKGVPVEKDAAWRKSTVHVKDGSWHFEAACFGSCK